ncbi:beta-ketoacyl-ACP synthase III [Azoarcus olearius]|uniref:Beta-ketoacyl-[acyl-carrier-protein] synthase III n=1 Tax=Azoarcus sp. (strain BH72) TaxID=418699 RepID=FABH_AZOSB|nr:beta-ketoacyl-ACP synthase III [Azoarcus olearius]A1K5Y5.1 RecName: Full=Beta-ketoacyl-[acyl-carrier-protein] synthase III; Short=Beta-ketoacyl-ACP synthase III; Short=KAS III; AltName: Full=3-oxoacyl-[acyl-carrier-protein] synthase 3; AltName: Full=3-oxoacyl-[acyl-carrier-protein] synthase III [Azoarcus olearius]ANQ84790.1 3-oxoacyl-ACP synthase [Azoarcus olearius]CAL94240.1 probable 3-oxoacyl-(acyl-carrier-protein) synthase III [Azoarcus olearius]
MIHARIAGTGSYLPGNPVSNDDLVARGIDTSDDWVVSRTGIRTRYLAPPDVGSSDLALVAAQRAIEAAGCAANDIDLIIVATSTPDYIFPSTATLLQSKLGIGNNGAAFDVQAVCSGFVYALSIAEKFIRSGSHKRALVVGAEVFSRILDWTDRATCVLFGDGAGAVVLEASERPGVLTTALHADGSHHPILCVPGNVATGQVVGDPFLRMDGQAVFKFAVKVLGDVAHEVLDAAGVAADSVDWLIPHQANIRIIQATAKRLGLSMEKVVATVDRHGNTSAASIPLALDLAVRDGRIRPGQRVVVEGVGGGFTWGAALIDF